MMKKISEESLGMAQSMVEADNRRYMCMMNKTQLTNLCLKINHEKSIAEEQRDGAFELLRGVSQAFRSGICSEGVHRNFQAGLIEEFLKRNMEADKENNGSN